MSFETKWRRPNLSAYPVTDHEKFVAASFTRILILEDEDGGPSDPPEWPVQMSIGVQFFTVGTRETEVEADWLCWQLAKALSKLILAQIEAHSAEIQRLQMLVEEAHEQRDRARNDAIESVLAEVADLRRQLANKERA